MSGKRKQHDDNNDKQMNLDIKKRRVGLNVEQKLEIINFVDKHPKVSQESVASQFSVKFKCHQQISRSTISVIMKNRDKYENTENQNFFKKRAPKHPVLEKCLMLWYCDLSNQNITVSDDMLILKARDFGTMIGISELEFSYSRGWLEKFKQRNNLFKRNRSGEDKIISWQDYMKQFEYDGSDLYCMTGNEYLDTDSAEQIDENLATSDIFEIAHDTEHQDSTTNVPIDSNDIEPKVLTKGDALRGLANVERYLEQFDELDDYDLDLLFYFKEKLSKISEKK